MISWCSFTRAEVRRFKIKQNKRNAKIRNLKQKTYDLYFHELFLHGFTSLPAFNNKLNINIETYSC